MSVTDEPMNVDDMLDDALVKRDTVRCFFKFKLVMSFATIVCVLIGFVAGGFCAEKW